MLRPLAGVSRATRTQRTMRGRTIKLEDRNNSTYILNSTCTDFHTHSLAGIKCLFLFSFIFNAFSLSWKMKMVRFVGKLWAAAAETQSLGCGRRFAPPSLALLFRVPQLLQSLGVALSHGVDDWDDKVANHDQHHLLKHPRQPVLILKPPPERTRVRYKLLISANCLDYEQVRPEKTTGLGGF